MCHGVARRKVMQILRPHPRPAEWGPRGWGGHLCLKEHPHMILTLAQVREPLLQILTGSGWGGVHPGVHLHKNPANHTGKMSALHQHVTPGCALDTGASTPGVPARCLYSVKLSRRCCRATVTAAVWLLLAHQALPPPPGPGPAFQVQWKYGRGHSHLI